MCSRLFFAAGGRVVVGMMAFILLIKALYLTMLINETLAFYVRRFAGLNRATVAGIKAPHKPVLLLAVMESIAAGEIFDNKIGITPQLVARFKDTWASLVRDGNFQPNFSLPFYHLSKEKNSFWHLQLLPGQELLLTSSFSVKSLSSLHAAIAFAYLDEPLYALLLNAETRTVIYNFILEQYFPGVHALRKSEGLLQHITGEILHDAPATYALKVQQADEEERFVRSGVFKRVVPQIYNYTCAITGMRIDSPFEIQMVDACHIIPFSLTHDDTIKNGISLCPNLHRAFDSGLISISTEYRVIVSRHFTNADSTHAISQFDGIPVLLPENPAYYPAHASLEWHYTVRFKK